MLIYFPNDKCYKEFCKNDAVKYYMPVWKLNELQLVAAHIHENVSDEFHKLSLVATVACTSSSCSSFR